MLIPDYLKSGVSKPCRYEPTINPSYDDTANRYGCPVIPTRVGKATNKAK